MHGPARAFTLIELMVAIAIFLIVSSAMLAILAASTALYRGGEASRAANDEMMAVVNLLDRDIARAVPTWQRGQFWAKAEADGDCIVGWTMEDEEAEDTGYSFVVWGVAGDPPDARLRRVCHRDVDPYDVSNTYPNDEEIAALAGSETGDPEQDVTAGVLHFGAWLAGTSDGSLGATVHYDLPADRFWLRMERRGSTGVYRATEPRAGAVYSTMTAGGGSPPPGSSFAECYPQAIRVTLCLTGGVERPPRGIVSADDGEQNLRVAGIDRVPSLPGTVVRVEDELVGIHGTAGRRLLVNDDNTLEQGPVHMEGATPTTSGRGVYRTEAAAHAKGTDVYFGRQYSLIRLLPGSED